MPTPDGDAASVWGLYPWFPERGAQLVHPDDLESLKQLGPYGKVFRRQGSEGSLALLHYGDASFRVDPVLFEEVPKPPFSIGDYVATDAGLVGQVRELHWHHRRSEPFFLLMADGEPKSRRYWSDELTIWVNHVEA